MASSTVTEGSDPSVTRSACVHEFASITTGSVPPSVQRSIASIVRARIASSAAA